MERADEVVSLCMLNERTSSTIHRLGVTRRRTECERRIGVEQNLE